MIDDIVVELDGRRFRWAYDPSVTSTEDCWSWSDDSTYMQPAENIAARLNRKFLKEHAPDIAGSTQDVHELGRFYHVLRSMGAGDSDFKSDSLKVVLITADPERYEKVRFDELPDPAHTPFSCKELRDWYFRAAGPEVTLPKIVTCIGAGPFDQRDFLQFVLDRGVIPLIYPTPAGSNLKSFGALGRAVIGRESWRESDVDALIEEHRGLNLRIYSQEMFTTMLACRRDPFEGPRHVLNAFCAGHPALNFVSEGWPGWVSTWVPFERSRRTSRTMPGGSWRVESPLCALGYHVGKDGGSPSVRRDILRVAFENELPKLGDAQYMAEWGQPRTPARLKKMADFLASNARNQKRKEKRSNDAIEDWEEDLEWLRETYYRGHFMFQWPDTFVD